MTPIRFVVLIVVATPVAAQSGSSLRDLERTCFRVTDNPTPENVVVLQPLIATETGPRLAFVKGCKLLTEEKWGPAGGEFEKASRAEPNEPVYHFWFGRATGEQAQRANPLRQPGLARRTKGEFERAVTLDSTYVHAWEGLLRYYLAAPGFLGGSIDNARKQAAEIVKLSPYRGGIALANVAVQARDTLGLISAHEGLLSQFPDSATPYLVLIQVQQARKQWPQAWSMVDRFEKARSDLPIVRYVIGRTAAESGDQLERGESVLRQYLLYTPKPNEPSLAATHWRLGMIAEKRGNNAVARQEYQTAATMDPKLKQAKEALSRLK
jgi:tetratricopeptide (TPR) repeat protein